MSEEKSVIINDDKMETLRELLNLSPNEKPIILITSVKEEDDISLNVSSMLDDELTLITLQESINALVAKKGIPVDKFYTTPSEAINETTELNDDSPLSEISNIIRQAFEETGQSTNRSESLLDKVKSMEPEIDESLLKVDPNDMLTGSIIDPVKGNSKEQI